MKRKTKRRTFSTGMTGGRPSMKKGNLGKISEHIRKGTSFIRTFDEYNQIADAADKYANILDTADQLHNDYVRPLKAGFTTKSKTKIGIVYSPSDHTNSEQPMVPAFVQNSSSKHVLANADDDRLVHKTVYHTGKKPSSGVLAAKKQNGSGYRVLADSMIGYASAGLRNILTQRVGFNQKQYHIPPIDSQVPMGLVKDLVGYDKFLQQEDNAALKSMSNVINIKQQFMIKNTAAHFPMKFTIHLVKIKNDLFAPASLNSLFLRTFYDDGADLNDFTVKENGKIPKWYQHDTCIFEGDTSSQSSRVLVSNKLTSLNKSSNFRTGADIVESFSKVLAPGDFWNFSHVHHCGDGIDLRSIMRMTDAGSETATKAFGLEEDQIYKPFHYGLIFECQGKTAEAYSIPAENIINSYIGSSPCNYAYEFRTSAYFAAEIGDLNNVSTPSVRNYEQSSTLNIFGEENYTREKFFLPTELASGILTPITANVGKAYVPMMTSTLISASSFEAGQDPG